MVGGSAWKALLLLASLILAREARAGSVCDDALASAATGYGERIAAIACAEHALWYSPFIDGNGRLASITVFEGEQQRLRDGVTPAWRRVADYWKGSGLLWEMAGFAGASDCGGVEALRPQSVSCRAFLADTPWSAVFVSFVLNRAAVPGFRASAGHIDYVRAAYTRPESSPFVFADPATTPAATGDLLCFARMPAVLGYDGLRAFLDQHPHDGLNMHCDIVIAANRSGDRKVYAIGGNVMQGVTLRVLNLNRNGQPWGWARLPAGTCSLMAEAGCSFNRQDWVALLKLKPLAMPTSPTPLLPQAAPQCCTECPLPMPPTLQRCSGTQNRD